MCQVLDVNVLCQVLDVMALDVLITSGVGRPSAAPPR